MQRISQRVLRLSLSGALLALLVLLTFNVGTTYADACGIATSNDAGTDCTMAIPSITANPGPLAYTADASLAITSGTTGRTGNGTTTPYAYTYAYTGTNNDFGISFHTTVSDHRGSRTGWNLAASTDLDSAVGSITLGTSSATTGTGCTSTCSPAFADLTQGTPTLTSTSKAFIGAPTILSGGPNTGDYAITTVGTLTILGSVLSGTPISGTITLTLNDAVGTFGG